jgi:hypothetical protein
LPVTPPRFSAPFRVFLWADLRKSIEDLSPPRHDGAEVDAQFEVVVETPELPVKNSIPVSLRKLKQSL